MQVSFHRGRGQAYHSLATRPDGVIVRLKGGSYNRFEPPLPHDIAHLVVEDELGLDRGVWGVIAAGGLFPQCRVISGRRRPHAGERARSTVKDAQQELTQCEMVVGAVCMLVHAGRERDARAVRWVPERWRPASVTPESLERCAERLRAAAADWDQVPVGGSLELVWGDARRRARAAHTR